MLDNFTDIEQMIIALSLSALIGMILGSFTTALIYRIPRNISWFTSESKDSNFARSKCPSCNHKLSFYELIPVFSWLFLQGKCNNCKNPIGKQYIFTELFLIIFCMAIYLEWGFSWTSLTLMITGPFIISLMVIDWQYKILPNQLVAITFIFGIIFHISSYYDYGLDIVSLKYVIEYLGGAIIYGFSIWLIGTITTIILKKESLGFGDVKFFIAAGMWLGLSYLPYFLLISGVVGIIIGILWRKFKNEATFPFGPALIISLFIGVYIQHSGFYDILKSWLLME